MPEVLSPELQKGLMNGVIHEADMASRAIQNAAAQYERPSVLYRPSLSIDGDQWCALYGSNLQDGVSGFGKSPSDAMWAFDNAWRSTLSES